MFTLECSYRLEWFQGFKNLRKKNYKFLCGGNGLQLRKRISGAKIELLSFNACSPSIKRNLFTPKALLSLYGLNANLRASSLFECRTWWESHTEQHTKGDARAKDVPRGSLYLPPVPGGGHLGIFWVGMCHPGLQIGAPFEKKIPLKLIPRSRNGPIFYTPF